MMRDRTRGPRNADNNRDGWASVPLLRRRFWRFYPWMLPGGAMCFAYFIGLYLTSDTPRWLVWLAWMGSAWVAIGFGAWMFTYRRLRSSVFRRDLLVCTACGYSLDPRIESGMCPECGQAFDLKQVRRDWQRAFRNTVKTRRM